MPSLAVSYNITGAEPGFWVVRVFGMIGGKLQHGVVGRFGAEPYYDAITMTLFDHTGASVGGEHQAPSSEGRCKWDGTLPGSGSDLSKNTYTFKMYFSKGGLSFTISKSFDLGLYDVNWSQPDSNVRIWEKWINKVLRNWDAGIPWWSGFPPDQPPYDWWHGYEMGEFCADFDKHHTAGDEPAWRELAPDMNARVTMVGKVTEGIARCPVCDTLLGFTTMGCDAKCPVCGFVSAYAKKFVERTYHWGKLETYKTGYRGKLEVSAM